MHVASLLLNDSGCPQGRPCLGLGRVSFFSLRGMPAGQAVSRFESCIFFTRDALHEGSTWLKIGSISSSLFFLHSSLKSAPFNHSLVLHVSNFIVLGPVVQSPIKLILD